MNPKISIVMAYYNRKTQFIHTLRSINQSKHKNIELIVVDDNSDPSHSLDDLAKQYPFFKLIKISSKEKTHTNPCVPYNIGIRKATGDIIVLQNPECLHVGDIMTDITNSLDEKTYIAYSCYALSDDLTNKLYGLGGEFEKIKAFVLSLPQKTFVLNNKYGWYNHPVHRPMGYHFLSAITKENMNKLNGFDERYKDGLSYDDDELLERIKRLGLKITIPTHVFAIHQFHSWFNRDNNSSNFWELVHKNENLLKNVTKRENIIKAN